GSSLEDQAVAPADAGEVEGLGLTLRAAPAVVVAVVEAHGDGGARLADDKLADPRVAGEVAREADVAPGDFEEADTIPAAVHPHDAAALVRAAAEAHIARSDDRSAAHERKASCSIQVGERVERPTIVHGVSDESGEMDPRGELQQSAGA